MPPFFYHADLRVDGILWFHTRSQPASKFYVAQPGPVVHNYALTLALAGFIADPDTGYASVFGVTRYKPPRELLDRFGVYAYPALVVRSILGETLMAAMGEGVAALRGRSRLAYPFFTKVTALMPGSMLRTLVVSIRELPRRLVVRIGAKRNGVLLARLKPVRPRTVEYAAVTHPFNTADTVSVSGYTVLLSHGAGDVAVFGVAERAWEYRYHSGGREHRVVVPALRGVEA